MANLDVQRKRSSPAWIWVVAILIVLVAVFYFWKGRNSDQVTPSTSQPMGIVTNLTFPQTVNV